MILREAQKLILRYGYQKVTMTDIAKACQISRTTLYKSYPNKESIIVGLINEALEVNVKESEKLLMEHGTLKEKLVSFFDIWTIQPAASVIELEAGRDILMNVATYAPDAVAHHYEVFENMLTRLIEKEVKDEKHILSDDLAHILMVASKGLKASAESIDDLKRMINSLIAIVVAAVD
ncbi:TetR/AcrR family transcriptional regulator [Pseudoalteromonas maricaloris]|uniref:TetR/AcrR family transcriptional regulator n=1 Tax=Pseudoalteromonas maricaloris TaxID=184924 RepID=UPI003C18A303